MPGLATSGRVFTREDFESGSRTLLREGRLANARVYRFRYRGEEWTVKDFSSRPWWVRKILAPILFWRELRAVHRLAGIEGVPSRGFRLDDSAIAIQFLPGTSLSKSPKSTMTVEFLKEMEALMTRIHQAGIVHLDARGTGNWVVLTNGKPGLIDFQAGVCTAGLPSGLRKILEDIDMSGVLKNGMSFTPKPWGRSVLPVLSAAPGSVSSGGSAVTLEKRSNSSASKKRPFPAILPGLRLQYCFY